jgi:NAD(P)-dependent dehydrogenase (short-subunit alcohol dehydrogenase family)
MNAEKVVLITGAGRGIGRGIAEALAGRGFSLAINYHRDDKAAEECRHRCRSAAPEQDGGSFELFKADISSAAARKHMIEDIYARFGRLDGLVNNAGIAPSVRADICEASEESFDRLIEVNLKSPYFLTREIVEKWRMSQEPGGPGESLPGGKKIVFVTSISAETASVHRGDYCISKAGLSMAAKLWAVRLAGEGIQVYELRPGIIKTDMTKGVQEKYDRLIGEGLIPQNRWGLPADVGRMAASLIGGDCVYAAGTVLYADGGFHLSRL